MSSCSYPQDVPVPSWGWAFHITASHTVSVTADPCPLLLTPLFTLLLVTEILHRWSNICILRWWEFGFGLQGARVDGDSEAASAQVAGCSALLQAGSPSQWSRVPCTERKRQSQHHYTLNSLMHSQEKSWNFHEKVPIWQSSSLPTCFDQTQLCQSIQCHLYINFEIRLLCLS